MATERISRDELYMGVADLLAQRSTCLRGHVGALVVIGQRVVSTGYNGSPAGQPHCLDVGCDELTLWDHAGIAVELGCQRATHAEINCIVWASRHGLALDRGHMYSTHSPCKNCAQAIVAAGIRSFTYQKDYRLGRPDILSDAGIAVRGPFNT